MMDSVSISSFSVQANI